MRKTTALMIIFLVSLMFSACKRVVETASDELCTKTWFCVNESGVSAKLEFAGSDAQFTISLPDSNKNVEIKGKYAVDSKKLYICDDKLCKTYEFDYTVYKDRLEISHNNTTLLFRPET